MAKYCEKCGKELKENAKFCEYCGAVLPKKDGEPSIQEKVPIMEETKSGESSDAESEKIFSKILAGTQNTASVSGNKKIKKSYIAGVVAAAVVVVIILAVVLGGKAKTIDLMDYVILSSGGYNGSGSVSCEFDEDKIEDEVAPIIAKTLEKDKDGNAVTI